MVEEYYTKTTPPHRYRILHDEAPLFLAVILGPRMPVRRLLPRMTQGRVRMRGLPWGRVDISDPHRG